MKRIAITGGPCCGKTTLLSALGACGYTVVEEAALAVIAELNRSLGVEGQKRWREDNRVAFHLMVDWLQRDNEKKAAGDIVLMDRSRIDAVAYLGCRGEPVPLAMLTGLEDYPLEQVWLLQPFKHFNARHHTGRDETREQALQIHESIAREYRARQYPVIEIPALPPARRLAHCLALLQALPTARA